MIDFRNISFKYEKKSMSKQLDNVTFTTLESGLVCIVGENGSGKSTLINQLSYRANFEGEILINKKDISKYKPKELSKLISFLPQKLEFPDNMLVFDVIAVGRNPYTNVWGRLTKKDKAIISKYSSVMQVKDLYKKQFSALSGGQQQRVLIAMVLSQEAKIIIFDEPTNHLDVRYQIEIFDLIGKIKKDKLILMTTHNLNMAGKYGDQFVLLKDGKIIDVGSDRIISKENIRKLFKVHSTIADLESKPVIVDMELDNGGFDVQ